MNKIEQIIDKIDNLPPLNSTLVKLIEFCKIENKENETKKLAQILQEDPFLTATLLKVANSAIFGFHTRFETIENIINILGVNFTISIALGSSIQSSFDPNFSPYGVDVNDFKKVSYLMINILNHWIEDIDIKNSLYLPLFLIDLGKCISSTILIKNKLDGIFFNHIKQNYKNIKEIEEKILGINSYEITLLLAKKWDFHQEFIDILNNFIHLKNTTQTKIIDVITHSCNICAICDKELINEGIQKAKKYSLNSEEFKKIITKLSNDFTNFN